MIGGGDNQAEKHRKRHRPILFLQLLPQTEKSQSINPQTTKYSYRGGTFNLAKFDKSNVARAKFFLGLSMVPLLKSASPISIFSGLGVDGLSFFSLGQYLQK